MTENTTETLGAFKNGVYELLEMRSVDGTDVSRSSGEAADIERRFPGEAARCLRRAAMIFPLCVRDENVTPGADGTAVLPAECDEVLEVRSADGKPLRYHVEGGVLTVEGAAGQEVAVKERLCPAIGEDTPECYVPALPKITYDAWQILTAMGLCPLDASELYAKLASAYNVLYRDRYRLFPAVKRIASVLFRADCKRRLPYAR